MIKICSEVYNFTDFKEISEYLGDDKIKDFIGSTGNNIEMLATSCNVVNQYNVIIKFEIEELEVK